jgi:anti-anti-sigma factor
MSHPAGYTCEVCTQAGAWRLTLGGEIDLAAAPLLDAALRLAQADALTVALDLRDVEFMDSSGIAVLIRAHQRAQRDGNELMLGSPSRPVCRLLEMCGVEEVLQIEDQHAWTQNEWERRHAVIATDLDGKILHWNCDAEALYGYTEEQALGRLVTDLTVAPTDSDKANQIMQAIRAHGRWQGPFDVARADGSTFRAWVRDIVTHDNDGQPNGLLGLSLPMLDLAPVERSTESA